MSRSEFGPDDSRVDDLRVDDSSPFDPAGTLEQHLRAGFPPDLALDLVLNEVVVRAAEATHAVAGALALVRDGQMVCRAATGQLAPDLGIPLNVRDGLSGACLETRQPQLSVDTEFDPRVDPAVSRRLGIRSILIVPVFEDSQKNAQFAGVLEVFSLSPAAFSHQDQVLLEGFAAECARIRQAAVVLSQRKLAGIARTTAELLPADAAIPTAVTARPPVANRPRYEAWTLALGGLAIFTTIAVSFLMGTRIGWLRYPHALVAHPIAAEPSAAGNPNPSSPPSSAKTFRRNVPEPSFEKTSARATKAHSTVAAEPSTDELVVYEKGKVIFRMKPTPAKAESEKPGKAPLNTSAPNPVTSDSMTPDGNAIVKASSTTRLAPSSVWLSPAQAEKLLRSRTEPLYPPAALATHRAGNVVLEVQVAEDGTVINIRTLSGDPLLASAAADAVRNWRYQPYRRHDHAAQFQTDVTLSFNLPN
ncbi:MAG TPA: TonB family protein [Terriglobales bacterium]|nr:TonB family protein [Terriglobales bacterium]